VLHDVRLACRLLLRTPSFALVAVVTLALGIGATTAIFSVVDGVLLRPAPVEDLDRLVMVWETDRNTATTREPGSVPDYVDYRGRSRTLSMLATFFAVEGTLALAGGEPMRVAGMFVTHDFFAMLGVQPVAGRRFTEAETRPGGPSIALVSESLWRRTLNADPASIGSAIRLNEEPFTVVGIVPDDADFGALQILSAAAYSRGFADSGARTRVDVWLPLQADPQEFPRSTHPNLMIGRLAPGVGVAAAQQELAGIAADLERAYPENAARGVFVEPLADVVFGPVRPALYVLLGAVGIVLLVACVNVANLLLARGAERCREVAVRTALGAGAARIARQFFAESLVLSLAAAMLGTALAFVGLRALVAMAPADVPRLDGVSIDLRVLLVTLVTSMAVGIVFGLAPTLQARALDMLATLKSEGRQATAGRGHARLRSGLVVAELALAIVLLVGAGLLIKSFWHLLQVDAGFQTAGVLKAEYELPASRYPASFETFPDFHEMHAFNRRLIERVERLPDVEAAAVAGNHPLDPGFTNSFRVVGREAEARSWPEISVRRVTPGYFQTVALRLLDGRVLGDADDTAAAPVCVINRAAAERFWPGRSPLGAEIRLYGAARRIVGVVANEKFQGIDEAAPIAIYLPLWQAPSFDGSGVLLVRASGDAASVAPAVRGTIRELDPALSVYGVEPLDETRARTVSQRRFAMLLVGVFAAVALTLAAVGIHGMLSYGVSRRTREIGIRVALGARPASVRQLIVGQGLVLTLLGLAIGLPASLALTRLLRSLLFGVTPTDPMTLAGGAVLLAAVAILASYVPARRATRVDPAIALRVE
jgi:putative ABC transport system permease protein